MTTAVATPDAPPVVSGEELIEEVALPHGMSFEDFVSEDDPSSAEPAESAGDKPTEPAAQPAAPTEKSEKPEAKADKPKGDVRVALKKTRDELKETKARLQKATSPNVWERIEAQRQEAQAKKGPTTRQRAAAPEVAFDRTKARAEASSTAEKAAAGLDTFESTARVAADTATEVALRHAEKLFSDWQTQYLNTLDYQRQLDQEAEMVDDLSDEGIDYHAVIRQSGLLPMIQTNAQGQPVDPSAFDPEVYKLVYGSPNPPKKAFRLAQQRLAYLDKPVAPADDDSSSTPATAEVAAPPTPATAVEAARQEGARQVVDRVNEHATKPRGVRAFRDAGKPDRVGLNDQLRRRLDRMAESEPEAFGEFCHKNPRIAKWWEDGGA